MRTYPVVDSHCDTLFELWKKGGNLQKNDYTVSLETVPRHSGYVQFFAAFLDDETLTPFEDACAMADMFHRELKQNKDLLQIKRAEDFSRAFSTGKVGAMLTVENGRALCGSLSNLQFFYELGVRAVTLTWNGDNDIAGGVMGTSGDGLSAFGRDVVREMNRLGVMVDVSHLSEKSFWDVLDCALLPPMASHSNAKAICGHPRNLTDEQIRALSEAGGVIGLNLYPVFLQEEGRATLEDCLHHIEHIAAVGGENCLGLGSDFDGFSGETVCGLTGPADYQNLFCTLQENGFRDSFLNKIAHENWVNYAKTVIK